MIHGILTFKPLASGEVQIMIKGKPEDIPELARLYGKEVAISLNVEKAQVQSSDGIFLKDMEEAVGNLLTAIQTHNNGVKAESRQDEASSPEKKGEL